MGWTVNFVRPSPRGGVFFEAALVNARVRSLGPVIVAGVMPSEERLAREGRRERAEGFRARAEDE